MFALPCCERMWQPGGPSLSRQEMVRPQEMSAPHPDQAEVPPLILFHRRTRNVVFADADWIALAFAVRRFNAVDAGDRERISSVQGSSHGAVFERCCDQYTRQSDLLSARTRGLAAR